MSSLETRLIQDLAVIMLIAGIVTVLFHRFKQPVVLGYIIVGIIIGPHTPPVGFIHDERVIKTLAELGVIFLMFSLGLEFNIRKLSKVGVPATVAALTEIIVMILIGYEIGCFFDWNTMDSLFLGGILAISSTTIIVRTISDLKLHKHHFVQLIYGILIIEDILGIALLALLSGIASTGEVSLLEIGSTVGKLLLFLVIALLSGILVVPKLLAYVAKFKSNEVLLITVLGLCFGFCLIVIKLNYSVVLGAFVIGTIIAESKELKIIEHLIEPLRNMFSAIFFVTVGLLLDPDILIQYWAPIIVITLAVVLGKVITCSLGAFITGCDGRTSLKVGLGLAQIGEFSFIIASLGIVLNVTSHFLYSIAVAVSVLTTLFTPHLIKFADPMANRIAAIMPKPLVSFFGYYTDWLKNIKPGMDQQVLIKMVNRLLLQVLLNLIIVVAIFLGGSYFSNSDAAELITLISSVNGKKTIIWGVSLIVSLPFLIAAHLKLSRLSFLLAQMGVNHRVIGRYTKHVRIVVADVIPIISVVGIILLISTLSVGILPPLELLGGALLIVVIITMLLWPWFIRVHGRLEKSLMETIKKEDKEE